MISREKRLHEVFEHLRKFFGIHTQTDFAVALKYSRVYISSALNGNVSCNSTYSNSDFDSKTTSGTYYSGNDTCMVFVTGTNYITQLAFSLRYTGELLEVIARGKSPQSSWTTWKCLYKKPS